MAAQTPNLSDEQVRVLHEIVTEIRSVTAGMGSISEALGTAAKDLRASEPTLTEAELDRVSELAAGLDDAELVAMLLTTQKTIELGRATRACAQAQTRILAQVLQRFVPTHVSDQAFALYFEGDPEEDESA